MKKMRKSDIYKMIAGCNFDEGISKLIEAGFRVVQVEDNYNIRLRRNEQIVWVAFRTSFKKRPSWVVIA